jgi:hypothetical protein
MNDVIQISDAIRTEARKGKTLKEAARIVKVRQPATCLRVMEAIGSWPSSEPELAALQAVWP